jgi:hypothetical protein
MTRPAKMSFSEATFVFGGVLLVVGGWTAWGFGAALFGGGLWLSIVVAAADVRGPR